MTTVISLILIFVLNLALWTPSHGIIIGTTIIPNTMPYMAGLKIKGTTNRTLCGGTLVSQNYILTAASCAIHANTIEVILGAHYLNASEKTQLHTTVDKSSFKIHPEFNETSLENDIALLKLPKPVELNKNINVIKIATPLDVEQLNLTGEWAITAGWGLVSTYKPTYNPYVLALWLNLIENDKGECVKWFGDRIKETNLCCAGYSIIVKPSNICEGDFGGPLVLHSKNFLIGVSSFTYVACAMAAPNVFTNVMKYTTWIAANSDVKFDS